MWRNRMPDLEVGEICRETNLLDVTRTRCAGICKTTNVRPNRRNSRSNQGRRTLGIIACSIRGVEGRARGRSGVAGVAEVPLIHFSLSMLSAFENLLCLLKAWYWSTCAGSLYENVDMTFENRLKIAQGAAEGLLYLHTFANPPIIHRDIKPANLLLAKEYNVSAAFCNMGIVCNRHTRTYTYVSLWFPCHR